jgi:hypothetical protein
MRDENEVVTIEMMPMDRVRLQRQITDQMERLGFEPGDWNSLDLGFALSDGWPVDMNDQPTISQLLVFAVKLKMRVIITGLNMTPMGCERLGNGDGL